MPWYKLLLKGDPLMKYPRRPPLEKTSRAELIGYLAVGLIAVIGIAILAWFNN